MDTNPEPHTEDRLTTLRRAFPDTRFEAELRGRTLLFRWTDGPSVSQVINQIRGRTMDAGHFPSAERTYSPQALQLGALAAGVAFGQFVGVRDGAEATTSPEEALEGMTLARRWVAGWLEHFTVYPEAPVSPGSTLEMTMQHLATWPSTAELRRHNEIHGAPPAARDTEGGGLN